MLIASFFFHRLVSKASNLVSRLIEIATPSKMGIVQQAQSEMVLLSNDIQQRDSKEEYKYVCLDPFQLQPNVVI